MPDNAERVTVCQPWAATLLKTGLLISVLAAGCTDRPTLGAQWEVEYFDTILTDIAEIGTDVWITGRCSGLFRHADDHFSQVPVMVTGVAVGLSQLAACPNGTAWGIGGGQPFHFDGSHWTNLDNLHGLQSIRCTDDEHVWAATSRTIVTYDRGIWRYVWIADALEWGRLRALWGSRASPNRIWAVGDERSLRIDGEHVERIEPLKGRFLSHVLGREHPDHTTELYASAGNHEVWRRSESDTKEAWTQVTAQRPLLFVNDGIWSADGAMLQRREGEQVFRDEGLLVNPQRWNRRVDALLLDQEGWLWAIGSDRDAKAPLGVECNAWETCPPCGAEFHRSFVARRRYNLGQPF
ncbi:MAG: hypothetical protein JRH20_21485 [Deltaproteobacteria bacterium]|nr:hypothetical protein [Deltaproteobacteria bacterium]